jgi:hypothetical protein
MSDVEVIPAEGDAISRKNSEDNIIAKLENCFGMGEDPIVDLINREERHVYTSSLLIDLITLLTDRQMSNRSVTIQVSDLVNHSLSCDLSCFLKVSSYVLLGFMTIFQFSQPSAKYLRKRT